MLPAHHISSNNMNMAHVKVLSVACVIRASDYFASPAAGVAQTRRRCSIHGENSGNVLVEVNLLDDPRQLNRCVPRSRACPFSDTRIVPKPSHRVLPPGRRRLKLKICRLFDANNMCKFDAEIKLYKDAEN